VYDDEDQKVRRSRRAPNAEMSVRQAARDMVDPRAVVQTMVDAMNDSAASWKDRLAAAKMIADRRDGLPVATILAAHVSEERLLRDIPTAALDQIEGILRAQLKLGPGEELPELNAQTTQDDSDDGFDPDVDPNDD
jgi:hypothetical protein